MKKLIITVMMLCAASVKKYLFMVVIGLLGIVSIINAQNGPWTAKCSLPERNSWLASCTLDGKIYIIGGATDNTVLSAVEVYDPVTDTWDTTRAEMSGGRWGLSANVVDGKIYAFGGVEGASGPALSKVEVYDPGTDTWELKAAMPTRRVGFASCVVDDKIYVLGGAPSEPFQTPFNTVDVYDPEADSWNTLETSLPTAIAFHTACVVDGKIYVIGGTSQSPWTGSVEIEEYDPVNDQWTRKKEMPTGRWALTSCVENGKIYVIGGTKSPSSGGSSKVEEYDPATDTWNTKAEMPTRRLALSASEVEGKIYTFGGHIVSYPWIPSVATVEEYDHSIDLLTLIEEFKLSKSYAIPGIDSVCITTKVTDPTGMTLMAEIEAPDQTPIDSLQLFDDGNHHDGNAGDSLYANVWPVGSTEERKYYVDLTVTRIDTDTTMHHMENMTLFTTKGPVVLEAYTMTSSDTAPNPGDRLRIKLTLKNNGTQKPVRNIKAKLLSLDSLVDFSDNLNSFDDMAPGETAQCNISYRFDISKDCPPGTEIPFEIEISDDDYVYWYDTFSIMVEPPTAVLDEKSRIPKSFALKQNYPNPFNPTTTIRFDLPKSSFVTLKIFNVLGKEIATLINEKRPAGEYIVEWNSRNDSGQALPSGVYFLELVVNGFYRHIRRMVLMK